MAIRKITKIKDGVITDEDDWWMIYKKSSNLVIEGVYQCKGTTYGPSNTTHVMVIADTKEELLTYITDNGLTISDDISQGIV